MLDGAREPAEVPVDREDHVLSRTVDRLQSADLGRVHVGLATGDGVEVEGRCGRLAAEARGLERLELLLGCREVAQVIAVRRRVEVEEERELVPSRVGGHALSVERPAGPADLR